jgi:hypothetical protein
MRLFRRCALAVTIAVALLSLVVLPASAHERRQVGPYVVVVGFDTEPAYLEELNAASIQVFRADGQPLEGVDKSLKVEVSTGGSSRTFDLRPKPGRPGTYIAEFIPTRTGVYVFRLFGTLESLPVDERFESGPNRFDEVVAKTSIQFPQPVPGIGELAAAIQKLDEGSASGNGGAAVTRADLQKALDRADAARTTGLIAGGLGILAGGIGIAVALAGRRDRAAGRGGREPSEPA